MNKDILAIGLVIVILGLGLSLASNSPRNTTAQEKVTEVEDKWVISGDFHEGENLTVYFTVHNDWSIDPYPELGEPSWSKHLMIKITNKAIGNYTMFRVILAAPREMLPPDKYGYPQLQIYDIELVVHGGVIVDERPRGVQGIVKNDGEYRVECELIPETVLDRHLNGTLWRHPASPPPQLILYRVTTETEYPFSSLLAVGLPAAASGCALSFLGARKRSTSNRRSRKHRAKILMSSS